MHKLIIIDLSSPDDFQNHAMMQKFTTVCSKLLIPQRGVLTSLRYRWSLFGGKKKDGKAKEETDIIDTMKKWMYFDYSSENVLIWMQLKEYQRALQQQMELKERIKYLGVNQAAALFILVQGGAVKFEGHEDWVRFKKGEQMKNSYEEDEKFEIYGIDASGTDLMFEGLENLYKVENLKYLNLSRCRYIDDFCLSKLCMWKNTLEYLDVSRCDRITKNGLICLHSLKNLKYLRIADMQNVNETELITLLLEETCPHLTVLGVNHQHLNSVLEDSNKESFTNMGGVQS